MEAKCFELRIERFLFSKKSTIGVLSFNGIRIGYTLEPPVDSGKLIENDVYSASIAPTPSWSRFARDERYKYQIRLEDKNGRKGILIHIGNTSDDTEGCILVGHSYGHDSVCYSALCYEALVSFLLGFARLASFGQSDVFHFGITVVNK